MSTEVDRSISPGAPQEGTLEAALYGVLTRTAYYEAKWKALRLRETSDEEIQDALRAVIGPNGVTDSSRGICHIKCDRFWFGSYVIDREPDLEGAALVAKVREVLGLPKSGEKSNGNGKRSDAAPAQLMLFDYARLDQETAVVVQEHTSEIKARVRRMKQDAAEIGQRLIEVRARLQHGMFGEWLRAEFQWSDQTARNFIHVAEFAEANPKYFEFEQAQENIAQTALMLIAAPSVPEQAQQEALERATQGEKITVRTARQIIEKHKPDAETKGAGTLFENVTTQSAPAEPEPGTCRVCGCSELEPCVTGEEGGETCSWAVGEHKTLCTSCRDLMQDRGLSEESLRARLRSRDEEGDRLESAAERLEPAHNLPAESKPEPVEAEVVATGRTDADLVSIVKSNENGMLEADLLRMGFTPEQIERARQAGQIVKEIGKWYYNSEPATITHKAQVSHAPAEAPDKRPARIEDLLNGRILVVTYTYIPQLPGKVSVGVRVGDDPLRTAYESLDSAKVRQFPERVLEMIAEQIKAAGNKGDAKKPAAKKAAASRRAKPAAGKAATPQKKAAATSKSKPANKGGAKKVARKSSGR